MNYDEADSTRRRIPVYLENSSGSPVAGLTLTGSEVQVSLSGAAFVNGGGVVVEVGSGLYYYEATQAETVTNSFLMVKVVDSTLVALPFVYAVDIGTRVMIDEPLAAARRVPIYLVNSSGTPVTGLTLNGSEVQVSQNGAAFANAANVPAPEIGSGAYYYELAASEVGIAGVGMLKVADVAANTYVYSWDVVDLTGLVSSAVPTVDACGYFGGYFGLCDTASTATPVPVPSPVESPLVPSDPAYLDVVAHALDRLCEYAKRKTPI